MSLKPDEAKAGLIEITVEHARAKLPPEQAARLEAFLRIYYGAVAADDLLERSVVDLYGAALAHFNFGAKRAASCFQLKISDFGTTISVEPFRFAARCEST